MDRSTNRLNLHGLPVELSIQVPELDRAIQRILDGFEDEHWPDGFVPTAGCVRPYDPTEVSRSISFNAVPVHLPNSTMDLYEDAERFWVVDDRWGMVEINLLKNQFRTWILPHRRVDDVTCAESAILWPLAQLLRGRELFLLPAVGVARDGWGALLLTPFALENELRLLAESGYQIIGQRWCALRFEPDRVSLLHMPGPLERGFQPRRRIFRQTDRWVDLNYEYADAQRLHAFCDTVLIATPGRHPHPRLTHLGDSEAVGALRRDWPIAELHPQRRNGPVVSKLVQCCQIAEIQLPRHAHEFLRIIEALRPMNSRFLPGTPSTPSRAVAV